MSSWTDRELEMLSDPDNHKMVFDGYDWRWYARVSEAGHWQIHSVKYFDDFQQAYGWQQYNLSLWSNELRRRRLKIAKKNQRVQYRIHQICKEQQESTRAKVEQIHKLKPELSASEISNLLKIAVQTARKYIKASL